MDPFLWAYGLMAQQADAGDPPRDPERLRLYRECLGLTLVETQSLAQAHWSEAGVPACGPSDRLDILRALALAARSVPEGWAEERRRLVRLAERFSIPPLECANTLVEVVEQGAESAPRHGAGRRRPARRSRRGLLLAGGLLLVAGVVAASMRFYERRTHQDRFAGFAERFGDGLLVIEVEYDLLLGTGRVPHRSLGMGFFVSSDGLFVTNKHVLQPWKFVAELVRKIDSGYVLAEDSIRMRAWSIEDVRPGPRGRFDESNAFTSAAGSLQVVHITPDQTTQRALALPEGGVHRGEYHVLDRSNLVLLRARVAQPVHAFELAPGEAPGEEIGDGEPVLALGLSLPDRTGRDRGPAVRSSLGRVYAGNGGVLKLTASVRPESSGGPVLDVEGRAVGIATHRLGDSEGSRCIPADAVRELIRLGE